MNRQTDEQKMNGQKVDEPKKKKKGDRWMDKRKLRD